MIKLLWNQKWISFNKIEWSGTHNQCSRKIVFSLPSNPYDKDFENIKIKLGDLICMYDDKDRIFVGTITSREKEAGAGTAAYTAMDFMHHLIRSTGTYKFKAKSPEKITKQVCKELGIETSHLEKTNVNIPKIFFEEKGIYDIIVTAYKKACAKTGKKYMPVMDGKKLSVITKGNKSGVTLEQGVDITSASYSDTTDNIVNVVKIYNESMKQIGKIQNEKSTSKYGIYQSAYKKENGVNAKTEAQGMLKGVTKEASISAIGNIKAISGYSIVINEKATGLSGTFYITSDSHTFENGVHTMSLELEWRNSMDKGTKSTKDSGKNELTDKAKAYYLDGTSVYHSSTSCTACKGKKAKCSTVGSMKKIKITVGANKGKRKYKPCAKCWIT